MGQEVLQREGQIIEREAGQAAQMADNGALLVGSPPLQVRGTRGVVPLIEALVV